MPVNPNIFAFINEEISDDIRHELRLQGHYNTGELDRSFIVNETLQGDSVILHAEVLSYIQELEEPTLAGNIHNVDINRLAKWVLDKGVVVSFEQARTMAFRLVQKWQERGRPLEGAKDFSSTGEVLHAIRISFTQNENRYMEKIDAKAIELIDQELHKTKSGKVP